MEASISILSLQQQDIGRDINSPRTLEACLRAGYDPSELYPRKKKDLYIEGMSNEMLDIKYDHFEKKRQEKIRAVIAEREALIKYKEQQTGRKQTSSTASNNGEGSRFQLSSEGDKEKKRMEAVKRRQEKEMSKIIQKEQAMVTLQAKIKKAEDEAIKKQILHDKKVAEQKILADKKKNLRAAEIADKEREELEKRKELAKREAEFERKKKNMEEDAARQLQFEASRREKEREMKMEEHRKKTEALIEAQIELAEENRQRMLEREQRVRSQLDTKVQFKKEEIIRNREEAAKRIAEALERHHKLHEDKKEKFAASQAEALKRAKEIEQEELQKLKKQTSDREARNRVRYNRLIEASKIRADHRSDIVARREEKDKTFDRIQDVRSKELSMKSFVQDITKEDKRENVERVARLHEFSRLQTIQRIQNSNERYNKIQHEKQELLQRHREESKHSLCRKHAIADAMDLMRVTNDYTLLDQLFADKKSKQKKNKKYDEGDVEETRLNQTV